MDIATVFQGTTLVLWVVAVAVLALVVTRAYNNRPVRHGGLITAGLVLLAAVVSLVSAGLVFIEPQERGIVISAFDPKGYREQALDPGLHWIIPFGEYVVRYPISRQTYTMSIASSEGAVEGDDSITARTQDGQQIYVDASVIFAIDPNKIIQVHIEWQNRYLDDLVRAQSRGIIRDAVSKYRIDEVISSKRGDMVNDVTEVLRQKLEENGFILVDFVLRNITFSPEYAASVEQKQIAEQQALQAKFVVESKKQEADQAREIAKGQADAAVTRAEGDAKARLISAEAEAKSLQLIADVLRNNPNLLNYQYITKLAPNISVMLLPNGSPFLLPLPTASPTVTETPVAPVPTATP